MPCLVVLSFTKGFGQIDATPFQLGISHEISSDQLGEKRTLNVYLPAGYHTDDTSKYPVIYLLDGAADEDFIHVAGLMQFMNMMYMIHPSIIVGIANVNRKRDFTFPAKPGFKMPAGMEQFQSTLAVAGGSSKFIDFLEKEVQVFVQKTYRTNTRKTLIGQSLGGLLATEILFKKTSLFDHYIIVSPSLWWDDESLLQEKKYNALSFPPNAAVYIAVGKEGRIMENDAKNLSKLLKKGQYSNLTTHFAYFPEENHATILHQALYKAFLQLYARKQG
jgi:predicted alpha/beta superfamily hydrolase